MNETHVPYYDFRDWDVTQNDQVFQQAIQQLQLRKYISPVNKLHYICKCSG